MRSAGMLISRAFWTASRSLKLPSGLPPPSRAAIVISRLARVKACPRLASTTAFLCLIPAHFEWPDIQDKPPNMLSLILMVDTYPNKALLAIADNVTILHLVLRADFLVVHAQAA